MDTPRQWYVTDNLGVRHQFEDELAAWQFAAMTSWRDRAIEVACPDGDTFVIVKRSSNLILQVVRPL